MSIITVRSGLPSNENLVVIKNTLFVPSIIIDKSTGIIFVYNETHWKKLTKTVTDLNIDAKALTYCNADDLCNAMQSIYESPSTNYNVEPPIDLNLHVGYVTYHQVLEEQKLIKQYSSCGFVYCCGGLGIMSYNNSEYRYQWGISTAPLNEKLLVEETPERENEVREFKDTLLKLLALIA